VSSNRERVRERVEAARKVAAASGSTMDRVLEAVAPTWGVSGHELAQLKHLARTLPASPTAEHTKVAKLADGAAKKLAAEQQAAGDASAALAYRNYQALKATNPHAAALAMNANADEINRGRELAAAATPDPEPPQAA
jgi:hypothetical protein